MTQKLHYQIYVDLIKNNQPTGKIEKVDIDEFNLIYSENIIIKVHWNDVTKCNRKKPI